MADQLDLFGPPVPAGSLAPSERLAAASPEPVAPPPLLVDGRIAAVVDELLVTRGEVRLADCLRRLALVDDDAADILPALRLPAGAALAMLEQVIAYGTAQGLQAHPRPDPPRALATLLDCTLVPPTGREQTDLFQDSALTVALNGLRQALAEQRWDDAGVLLARLDAADVPERDDYRRLYEGAIAPPPAAAAHLRALEDVLVPVARRRLGTHAVPYLTARWRALARALDGARFSPAAPCLHASHAHAAAGDWEAVVACVEAEPDWDTAPVLCVRRALALSCRSYRAAARLAWSQLCWRHPSVAAREIGSQRADAALARLWDAFEGAEIGLPVPDFPAWLLIADPQQAGFVPPDAAPQGAAGEIYRLVHALVASGGAMATRKALHARRPELLKVYFAAARAT